MHSVTSNAVAEAFQGNIVSSITLYSGDVNIYPVQTYPLYGAYGYDLLGNTYPAPQGFHYEYVLSAQGCTTGNAWVRVAINNISTDNCLTWSGYTYRKVVYSPRFKLSDIVLESVYQYSSGSQGCNLYIIAEGDTSKDCHIYNITLTAFLVKD